MSLIDAMIAGQYPLRGHMILWTLISIAVANLSVLPTSFTNFGAPVMIKWWLNYLVPLDELVIYIRKSGDVYFKLYDTRKDQWVYVDHETLKILDESTEPTIILPAPCKNDLGFKALRSLLIGPIFCEIYLNREMFRPHHIELIPPEVLTGLSSNEMLALIGPISVIELINHYINVGIVHVLWRKLFDKSGKCVVLDWHQRPLMSSRYLGLEHLTMDAMLSGWHFLVPRLNLRTVVASLTPKMWDLFIEYMARICLKETSEVRKWHPLMLLVEMGLSFDDYHGLTFEDLRPIVEHFCDREVLGFTVMKRIELFLGRHSEPDYRLFVIHMIHHYWENMVKIVKLSERIIDEYIISRRIMGEVPIVAVLDPLFLHLSSMKESEFSPEVCRAILHLWPWPEFRRTVLASLIHADFSVLASSEQQFKLIQSFSDFFHQPEFFEHLTFATLRWLESNVDYVLPKQFLFNLSLRVRRLTEWIDERTMIHLILMHQSQFFDSMEIPEHVCQTVLADIMMKVDPYYLKLIPNIMQQLSTSKTMFAYLRRWNNPEPCPLPIEFIVKYMCPENIMDESGPPLVEFRSEYLDLDHRVIMAAFHRKSKEFTSGAQVLRFQWWLSQRTLYHDELHAIILDVLEKRFPASLSLEILMESYCDYFMLSGKSWADVWSHVFTLGDGVFPVNLLAILNLRKNQDISEAINTRVFEILDETELIIFSLDLVEMHPHLIGLTVSGKYFNDPNNAIIWSKTDGSNLLIALLKDEAVDLAQYLSKPNIYKIDRKEVAKLLQVHPVIVDQMVELRHFSSNLSFFQEILSRYPSLPISYLAQVFKEQDEDAGKTRAYLDKNTI